MAAEGGATLLLRRCQRSQLRRYYIHIWTVFSGMSSVSTYAMYKLHFHALYPELNPYSTKLKCQSPSALSKRKSYLKY